MDGWLPGAGRAPAVRGGDGAAASPATPGWSRRPSKSPTSAPSTCGWPSRGCPSSSVPPGHTPISWLRELCREGADERYAAHPGAGRGAAAARARGDRGEGLPGLLPDRARHGRLRPGQGHPLPGPGIGGQLGGLLRALHHRGRPDHVRSAVRAVPVRDPGRGAGHRRRLRLRPTRGGDPGGLQPVRPAQRRPGGQRDQLPAEVGGPGHGQGTRLLHRPAGRLVQADRLVGASIADARRARHPGAGGRAGQRAAEGPAAPRHPLRRDGADRAAGRRGVPDRARPDGRPHRAAVGQGQLRLRWAWSSSTSSGWGSSAAMQYTLDPWLPTRRDLDAADDAQGGARGVRHALPGRLDRGVPGGEPGPGRHPAPAAAAEVLRPGDRDRADPAGTDPGWGGASLHPAGHRPGGDHLPAPGAEAGAGDGRWGCRCSRSS